MADWKYVVRARLKPLGLTALAEAALAEELAQHLEDLHADLRRAGRGRARRFGGIGLLDQQAPSAEPLGGQHVAQAIADRGAIALRRSTPRDGESLEQLAELTGAHAPAGPALLAGSGGAKTPVCPSDGSPRPAGPAPPPPSRAAVCPPPFRPATGLCPRISFPACPARCARAA